MTCVNTDYNFPYCDINTVYLKCGTNEVLKQRYADLIRQIYPECAEVIYPITGDDITNRHFTYGVCSVHAESYAATFHDEVYAWHVNHTSIIVPYGSVFAMQVYSDNWLAKTARALRSVWHGARLIANDDPFHRNFVNISIPWLPLDKAFNDCSNEEITDYCELVLAAASAQIWVANKRIITQGA